MAPGKRIQGELEIVHERSGSELAQQAEISLPLRELWTAAAHQVDAEGTDEPEKRS